MEQNKKPIRTHTIDKIADQKLLAKQITDICEKEQENKNVYVHLDIGEEQVNIHVYAKPQCDDTPDYEECDCCG